jgi:hypothetical protein
MGRIWRGAALAGLVAGLVACGGGDNSFVGVGNSGNRIFNDDLDELAEQLHAWPDVPQVEERDLARIYQALVQRAREGDPGAARVVLGLAERQREDRAEDH